VLGHSLKIEQHDIVEIQEVQSTFGGFDRAYLNEGTGLNVVKKLRKLLVSDLVQVV